MFTSRIHTACLDPPPFLCQRFFGTSPGVYRRRKCFMEVGAADPLSHSWNLAVPLATMRPGGLGLNRAKPSKCCGHATQGPVPRTSPPGGCHASHWGGITANPNEIHTHKEGRPLPKKYLFLPLWCLVEMWGQKFVWHRGRRFLGGANFYSQRGAANTQEGAGWGWSRIPIQSRGGHPPHRSQREPFLAPTKRLAENFCL